MFVAFRVRKAFGWYGWHFAPKDRECNCACTDCTEKLVSSCQCADHGCGCTCGTNKKLFAGDIWLVEERHPRLEAMMVSRFAIPDLSIPSVDELLKQKKYRKLTMTPEQYEVEGLPDLGPDEKPNPELVGV